MHFLLFLQGSGLIVRGVQRVSFDTAATAGLTRRTNVADMLFRPLVRTSPLGATTPAAWAAAHKATFSGVKAGLPASLHLLTSQSTSPTTLLLR